MAGGAPVLVERRFGDDHGLLPGGRADGLGDPKCTKKNGLQACVAIDQPQAAGITSQELLSRITLIGPDEAKWTTHVIG